MKYAEDRLGPERTATEAYRMRSIIDLNPILGSDFPVEPADPFQGIFTAITRRSPHTGHGAGGSTEGWHMEEALTLDQALQGFTTNVAYGGFMEGKSGVIKEGAFADWIVLDAPIEMMEVASFNIFRSRRLGLVASWSTNAPRLSLKVRGAKQHCTVLAHGYVIKGRSHKNTLAHAREAKLFSASHCLPSAKLQ